ncbi:MAG: HAD family hydrolase [Anaerolineae bacterium]|jgi:phosphoglycolate phosphatase|nr:HAD family hydrolase [Chloroflexota bacterium]
MRSELIPGTSIEVVRRRAASPRLRMALLDLDGTLSLIRAGWQTVMADRMVADLLALGTGETEADLRGEMMEMIDRTTGEPTAHQMAAFAQAVARRGGEPLPVEALMERYRRDLASVIDSRHTTLAARDPSGQHWLVPGARGMLQGLQAHGIGMFLASGTDHDQVVLEAELLGLTGFFQLGIAGAVPPPAVFTKDLLVERLIREGLYTGGEMLGIGDGPVEISAVARAGGIAIGVASTELQPGTLNVEKRQRLIDAGAHLIVADLSEHEVLLAYLADQGHL